MKTILLLLISLAQVAHAHTLGVDKAELIELRDKSYHLVSRVPPKFQALISTPELPEKCVHEENSRGSYEVRYLFRCENKLTSNDVIVLPWRREGVMMTTHWLDQQPITRFVATNNGEILLNLEEFLAGSGSIIGAAKRYTMLGMEHILEGIDHLLFVVALIFVVGSGWMLVKTITAFTVAHSITLALATLGYVEMPSAPVEATIALSIVFLCVEIIHAKRGRRGITYSNPWIVAFIFGLLHGLGFAGALSEIGLPPSEIPIALLFFNIGVELGQLVFVFIIIGLILLFRYLFKTSSDSKLLVKTECMFVYIIGITASYWLIERSLEIISIST